jgi:hypothetical protein
MMRSRLGAWFEEGSSSYLRCAARGERGRTV